MSWQIFLHSVRQVFANLGGALRVSAVLTVAQVVVVLTLGAAMFEDRAQLEAMMRDGSVPWGKFALAAVLQTVLWLWLVVGWHRYVLLGEEPGVVPVLRLDRMLGYFGKSLLIALLLIPVALVFSFVGGLIVGGLGIGASGRGLALALLLLVLLVYLPVVTIGTRLATMLPGAALEPGVPLFSGWEATRDATLTVMGVVVIGILCVLGVEFVGGRLFPDPASVPAVIWLVATQWAMAMVGASILTTLYGHYVQGRPLV